jgi:uncharacterized protein
MLFEWDDQKDRSNQKKHGLAFADALSVFDDDRQLSRFDDPHSLDEERWVTLGRSALGLVCVVSHTYRTQDGEECIRIISARRATKNEESQYYSV